jgi:hypothetical protein
MTRTVTVAIVDSGLPDLSGYNIKNATILPNGLKMPQNIPNGHKICIPKCSVQRLAKIYPKWYFWQIVFRDLYICK